MATAYLAYLEATPDMPPILPQILLDMLSRGNVSEGLQGQAVGFLSALEARLVVETTKKQG